MSEDYEYPNIPGENYASNETVPIELDTRLEFLTQRFFFHEEIKVSTHTKHYIVEDIEVDPMLLNDPDAPLFYYLKQMIFENKEQFSAAKKYYLRLLNYCKTPFAKNDIVKLNYIFEFDDKVNNYFELVVVADYGEADRIDVENISGEHINKFLKNVCVLLSDLKKFDEIYHGNIFLDNIILVNNELKLSGFKPIKEDQKSWTASMFTEFGSTRLDLYLVGLLWLLFLNVKLDDLIKEEFSLSEVKTNIDGLLEKLPTNQKNDIVNRLLDLDGHPSLAIEDVILQFDEYYVLENIKLEQIKIKEGTGTSIDQLRLRNNLSRQSKQSRHNVMMNSKDTNLFLHSYDESEMTNKFKDEQQTARLYDSRDPEGNIIQVDGANFTLQEYNSIDPLKDKDRLINIKEGQFANANDLSNMDVDIDTMEVKINEEKTLSKNKRTNSAKMLLDEEEKKKRKSIRKLKSNAQFTGNREPVPKESNLDIIKQKDESVESDEEVDVYSYKMVDKISDVREVDDKVKEINNSFEVEIQDKKISHDNDAKPAITISQREEKPSIVEKDAFRKKTTEPVMVEQKIDQRNFEEIKKEVEVRKEILIENQPILIKREESKTSEVRQQSQKSFKDNQSQVSKASKKSDIFNRDKTNSRFKKTDKKSASIMMSLLDDEEEKPSVSEPEVQNIQIEIKEPIEEEPVNEVIEEEPEPVKTKKKPKKKKRMKKNNSSLKSLKKDKSVNSSINSGVRPPRSLRSQTKGVKPIKEAKEETISIALRSDVERLANLLESPVKTANLSEIEEEEVEEKPVIFKKKVRTNKKKKKKNMTIEELNRRMKKDIQISSMKMRKQMFHYNEDSKNKNISFKQMLASVKVIEKKEKTNGDDSLRVMKEFSDDFSNNNIGIDDVSETGEVRVVRQEMDAIDDLDNINIKAGTYIEPHEVHNQSFDRMEETTQTEQNIDNNSFDLGSQEDFRTALNMSQSQSKKSKSRVKKKKTKVKDLFNNAEHNRTNTMTSIRKGKKKKKSYMGIKEEKEEGNDFGYYSKAPNKHSVSINASLSQFEQPAVKTKKTITILDASIDMMSKEDLDSFIDENEFEEKIEEVRKLFEEGRFDECLYNLNTLVKEVGGTNKVDVYRMTSMVYHKMKNYKQSMINLRRAAVYVEKNDDLPDKAELQKSVLISLTVAQLENKAYDQAVKTLSHKVFKDKEKVPFSYFTLLGDAKRELGKYSQAYDAYNKQLSKYIAKDMDPKTIRSLFILVNKTVVSLDALGDDLLMVKFYRHALILIDGFIKVDSSHQSKSNEYITIKEHLLLTILGVLAEKSNFNMINFILDDSIKSDLIIFSNLIDEDRLKFVDFYLNFALYLKRQNDYGGQKASYIRYIERALFIIRFCEADEAVLKKELIIIFNQGLFYLQEKEFALAREAFEGSLRVFDDHSAEPDAEFFQILFNIAKNIYTLNKFDDAAYFFEKIVQYDKESVVGKRARKGLAKCNYRLGRFNEIWQLLHDWIYRNLDRPEKESKNFYLYLVIYHKSCFKVHSNDFEEVLARLRTALELNDNILDVHYFNIFYNVTYPTFRNKNYKENESNVERLVELVKNDKTKGFVERFVRMVNKLYVRYALGKNENLEKDNYYIIKALKNKSVSVEENTKQARLFLSNFVFLLVNNLPIDPHKERDFEFRDDLFNAVKRLKYSDKLYKYVLKTLKRYTNGITVNPVDVVIKDRKPDVFQRTDSEIALDFYQTNQTETKKKKKKKNFKKKKGPVRKLTIEDSERIARNLIEEDKGNTDSKVDAKEKFLKELIKSFLKQIKNMLFLGITEDIEKYYSQFEKIIEEKNLHWAKFIYIKSLFQFYFETANSSSFDSEAFSEVIESIVSDDQLRLDDYKLIIVFLESFNDAAYLEAFVLHMHEKHPPIARLLFTKLFLKSFEKKYSKIRVNLFKRLQEGKFHVLDNYPFLHYLNEENVLPLETEFTFKVFRRLRYDVLASSDFFPIFREYISTEELVSFWLRYNVYAALVQSIRKDTDGLKITVGFANRLKDIVMQSKGSIENCQDFLYDVLLFINVLRFNSADNRLLGEKLLQILVFLQRQLTSDKNKHQFAVLSSLTGNVLYKNIQYKLSVEVKNMALSVIEGLGEEEESFPDFFRPIASSVLLFNVFTILYMNFKSLNDDNSVNHYYSKISEYNTENNNDKVVQMCLGVLHFIKEKKFKKADKLVNEVKNFLNENELTDLYADLYLATVERLAVDIQVNIGSARKINQQRARSKGSLNKLYNHLVM